MDMRGLMLFLHVTGLALWFGVTLAVALLAVRANRTEDEAIIAFGYSSGHRLLKGPGLAGMALTTFAGFGLTGVGGYGFFELVPHWLFQMQVLGVLAFLLGVAVQIPLAGRLARAASSLDGTEAERTSFARLRKRNAIVSSVNGLLILVVILLGTVRPG